MGLITRIADKAGAFGSVVPVMGCAACFPVVTSLGAVIGLGFLQEYEDLSIFTLLSLFAVIALLANALDWLSHRQWHRSLLGIIGSAVVFARTVWLPDNWQIVRLVYTGLALMIGVPIWDLALSANRRCRPSGCGLPIKHD